MILYILSIENLDLSLFNKPDLRRILGFLREIYDLPLLPNCEKFLKRSKEREIERKPIL